MKRQKFTLVLTRPQRDEVVIALRNQLEWEDLEPRRGIIFERILGKLSQLRLPGTRG